MLLCIFTTGMLVGVLVMRLISNIGRKEMKDLIKTQREVIDSLMASNVKTRMEALNNTLEVVRRTGEIVNLAAVAVRKSQSKVTPSTN